MTKTHAQQIAEAVAEAAAKKIEGGSFLHDNAPDARLARAAAEAIRSLDLNAIIASVPGDDSEPFGYFHEMLDHEGKGNAAIPM